MKITSHLDHISHCEQYRVQISRTNEPAEYVSINTRLIPVVEQFGLIQGFWVRGKASLLIRKHDHYTPARELRRDGRAITARNHPERRSGLRYAFGVNV